jgi:ABC-type dipeptide/oligopeptide/nickel transport system permease component
MGHYITKRILLMGLTLFGISVIQFAVINMMPGRPSLQGQGGGGSAENQKAESFSSESDRKWRASHHFDKPPLLSTRPWLKLETIEAELRKGVEGKSIDRLKVARGW